MLNTCRELGATPEDLDNIGAGHYLEVSSFESKEYHLMSALWGASYLKDQLVERRFN